MTDSPMIILLLLMLSLCRCRIQHGQLHSANLESIFSYQFCGKCTQNVNSSSCETNKQNIFNDQQTNNFLPETVFEGLKKYQPISYTVFSVRGKYSFSNNKILQVEMQAIGFLPTTVNLSGVILYYHPTLFGIKQVPTARGNQILALAALYTSQGYAILFPNYLGYNYASQEAHPYLLFPQQNVQSGILALNEFKTTLDKKYSGKYKLFAVGYSEGAAYALWTQYCLNFNRCLNQRESLKIGYNFIASASLEGAYSLSSLTYDFLIQNVTTKTDNKYKIQNQLLTNFGKPGLLAMTLNSYFYYGGKFEDPSSYFQNEFYNMKYVQLDFLNLTFLILSKLSKIHLTFQKQLGIALLGKKLMDNNIPADQYLFSGENSINALLEKRQILNSTDFKQSLLSSQAIRFTPQMGAFIFSLERDSLVSVRNAEEFRDKNIGNKKVKTLFYKNQKFRVCVNSNNLQNSVNVDHLGAQLLSNIFALAYISK